MENIIKLNDGTMMPILGQGAWNIGENPARRFEEIRALRKGVLMGMTLIDTAEMYGEGLSEELVGEAIKTFEREDLFLVSKVYPHNAGRKNIFDSCFHDGFNATNAGTIASKQSTRRTHGKPLGG